MSQTVTVLKMKSLGFSLDQIAKQVGLNIVEVKEILQRNAHPVKKDKRNNRVGAHQQKNNRPPSKRVEEKPVRSTNAALGIPHPVMEVKPGFYVLTADDLLNFASRLQEQLSAPQDPYGDYVQKDVFQKEYGISSTTLQRHQKEGLLVVYKLGNKQYLRKSQVVAALEKGKL
jgi:DNA-binding transcriptional MerR regulator